MKDLRVTLVQTSLHWHDPQANCEMFAKMIRPLRGETDLIVLPEMFTTGFTMKPEEVAEQDDGASVQWLRETARELDVVLVGSISTRVGDKYYNRLSWVCPDGSREVYDKRHLFRMGREHNHYHGGTQQLVVSLNGWRLRPLVCYDLRFPVWSRSRNDYDALIYVANWPERRRYAWQTLLKARAIENLSYCIGVNRIGDDGAGVTHTGDSMAYDFLGQPMFAESTQPFVKTVTLSKSALEEHRTRFPAHLDADEFSIQIEG